MSNDVKHSNYIVIQGWAVTELGLKGNELIIYSIIHGFTQIDGAWFTGSLNYLAGWTNSTKQSVIKCLKSLQAKGYIEKKDVHKNGVKFCEYRSTKFNEVLNKVEQGIKQSLIGGSEQSLPNNITIDTINNNIDIDIVSDCTECQKIIDMYNSICVSLPTVKVLTGKRMRAIKTRIKKYSLEQFTTVFEKAQASDFLSGRSGKWTGANFDWLTNENNMIKVLEGNYDNKHSQSPFSANKDYAGGWD